MQAKISDYEEASQKAVEEDFIPEDWKVSKLGALVKYEKGRRPEKLFKAHKTGYLPYLTAEYFRGGIAKQFVDVENEASIAQVSSRDIVLIWDGSKAGDVFTGLDGVLASTMVKIEPNKQLTKQFLYYFLRTKFIVLNEKTTGSTIPHVSKSVFKNLMTPLPPLLEQEKITKVLSAIQKAIRQQDKIIQTGKSLKKSLMQKLFTKGLNTDNTKESEIGEIPAHWQVAKCQDVCEKITVGIVVKPASLYVQTGVPCFRSLNIMEDRLNENDLVFISHEANEMHSKSRLREGDVLVVRTGYPGTSCVVPRKYDGANCIDLVILRPGKNVMSGFLSRFFNSPAGRRQTLRSQGGLAQQHLNVGAVKNTVLPIPSLSEQKEIIRILSTVDSKIDVEESRKKTLEELFKSMLHKLMTAKIRLKDIEV